MEHLKEIKSRLESAVIEELNKGIENVDCAEMSETIDMLKDLAETMYHCAIVNAMESDAEEPTIVGSRMTPEMYRDMDYATRNRLYYTETESTERAEMGRSGKARMKYIEHKETGDSTAKMQALEEYVKALSEDITEMLIGATDNEKTMLRNKMQVLIQKI